MLVRGLHKNQSGDTIIEVLLAIAVVGIVLAGAYVSANRSLLGTQVSKERVEALQYARGQMEVLMQRLEKNPTDIPAADAAKQYCYDDLALPVEDNACTRGESGRYKVWITREVAPNDFKYTITAQWEKARGGDGSTPESIALNYNASR